MSRRWAYMIIFTVVTVVIWSTWEIYRALRTEEEVEEYTRYVAPISRELDTDLVKKISNAQNEVLVKESEITPLDQE